MKKNFFLRTISLFVVTCFVMTNPFTLPGYGKNTPQSTGLAPAFPAQLSSIQIPPEFGKIEEVFQGTGNKAVILLQDAHSISDAQRNIQNLIRHFQNRYGIKAVGLEGAASPLDPQIFHSFPDQEKLNKVLEEYLEKGELTGPAAAAIMTSPNDIFFQGIEDWKLYEQGTALYLAALQKEPELLKDLKSQQKKLESEKEKSYSGELLEIDRVLRRFHENHNGLLEVLNTLAKIKAPEKGSELALLLEEERKEAGDPKEIETEVKKIAEEVEKVISRASGARPGNPGTAEFNQKYQEFQTSRISAGDFMLFLKESGSLKTISPRLERLIRNQKRLRDLEGAQFFRSFENYAHSVKESLFRNEEERRLDQKSRELELHAKLLKLELSREEWGGISGISQSSFGLLQNDMRFQIAFYQNAEKREDAFLNHLMKKVMLHDRRAMLVTGGFHAEGLAAKLRRENISYLVVMPQINSIPENSPYRDQMRGHVSWGNYYRVENGKVSVYEAFVRAVRDQLLGINKPPVTSHQTSENIKDAGNLVPGALVPLKLWRDQIIRDLAEKEEIGKARRYTRFLDEVANSGQPSSISRPAWMEEAQKFIDGLKQLQTRGKLSEQNILKLLKPSTIPPEVLNLASGDNADFDLIRGKKDDALLGRALANLPALQRPAAKQKHDDLRSEEQMEKKVKTRQLFPDEVRSGGIIRAAGLLREQKEPTVSGPAVVSQAQGFFESTQDRYPQEKKSEILPGSELQVRGEQAGISTILSTILDFFQNTHVLSFLHLLQKFFRIRMPVAAQIAFGKIQSFIKSLQEKRGFVNSAVGTYPVKITAASRSEARMKEEPFGAGKLLERLSEDLGKGLNQDDFYDRPGPFIVSNETGWPEVLNRLKKAPSPEARIHIGVSGLANYDILAARKTDIAVLIDANKQAQKIHEIVKHEILAAGTPEELQETLARIFSQPEQGLDQEERLHLRGLQWLNERESFEFVKKIFLEKRILTLQMSLLDEPSLSKIVQWSGSNGFSVDTVYASSVYHWRPSGKEGDFWKALETLAEGGKEKDYLLLVGKRNEPRDDLSLPFRIDLYDARYFLNGDRGLLRSEMRSETLKGIGRLQNVILEGVSPKILKGTHLSEIVVLEPKHNRLNISLVRPHDEESVVRAKVANEEKALRITWARVRQELEGKTGTAAIHSIETLLLGMIQLKIRSSLEKSQAVIEKLLEDPDFYRNLNSTTSAILQHKLIPALEDRDEFLFLNETVEGLSPEAARKLIIEGQKDLVMIKLHDVILNLPYGFNTKVADVVTHERSLSFHRKQEFEKEIPFILEEIEKGNSPRKALENSIARARAKVGDYEKEIIRITELLAVNRKNPKFQESLDSQVHLMEVGIEQIAYLEGVVAEFDTYNFMYELNDPDIKKKVRIQKELEHHRQFVELALKDFPAAEEVRGGPNTLLIDEFRKFMETGSAETGPSEIEKGRPMQYGASKFFYRFREQMTDEFWEFLMRYYDLAENGDPAQKKSEKPITVFGEIRNESDYNRVMGKTRGLGKVVAIVMPKIEGQLRFPHWYIFAKKNGIVVLTSVEMKVKGADGKEKKLEFSDIHPGDEGMVDGKKGRLVINPDSATIERWQKLSETYRYMDIYHSALVPDGKTQDLIPRSLLPVFFEGMSVIFWADETNLDALKGEEGKKSAAFGSGMKGLGLFRLEEIILDPSRKGIEGDAGRLRLAFSEILNYPPFNEGAPFVMRLFDVAPDKRPHFLLEGTRGTSPRWNLEEVMKNFTGVRFYLSKDEKYREFREFGKRQLKAIFGAHLQKNIEKSGARILFSDVRLASEVDGIEELIREAREEFMEEVKRDPILAESLSSQDKDVIAKALDAIPVGYMFEDTIAAEKERAAIFKAMARVREQRPAERFIGIGSNDLSKSINQERMMGKTPLDVLNPLLLRDIRRIAETAKDYGIHVTLEGEWGGSAAMLLALLVLRKVEGLEVTPVAATAQIPELLDMARVLQWDDLARPLTDPETKRPLRPLTELVSAGLRPSLKSFLYENLFSFFKNVLAYPGLSGFLRRFLERMQDRVKPENWMPMEELNRAVNLLLDILQDRITGSQEFEYFVEKLEEAKEREAEKPKAPAPVPAPVPIEESHRSIQHLSDGTVFGTGYYTVGRLGFHNMPATLIFRQIKKEKWEIEPFLYSLTDGKETRFSMKDILELQNAGGKDVPVRIEVKGPESDVKAFFDFLDEVQDMDMNTDKLYNTLLADSEQTARRSEMRQASRMPAVPETLVSGRSEMRLAEDSRVAAGLFEKLKIKKKELRPEEARLLSSSVYAVLTKTDFENFATMFIENLASIHAKGETEELTQYARSAQAAAEDLMGVFLAHFGLALERGVVVAVHVSGEANDAPYHKEALQDLLKFIESFIVNGTVSAEFQKALAEAGILNKVRPEKNLDRIKLNGELQAVLPVIMGKSRLSQVLKNAILPVGIASEDYAEDDLTHYDAKFAVLLEYLIAISAAMTLEAKDFQVLRRVPADGKPAEESLKLQVAEIRQKVLGWLEKLNPGLAGGVNFEGGQANIMMKQIRAFIQEARSEARISQAA